MRASSDSSDPGYAAFSRLRAEGKTITVFLNGEEVKECDLADDEEGLVRYAVLDDDGHVQLDPSDPDKVWVETAHGAVEILVG